MDLLLYALLYFLGMLVGFLLKSWFFVNDDYSGTIYVTTSEEKTLYSLELEDYPETIQFKKEVVFKVDTSGMSSDRA